MTYRVTRLWCTNCASEQRVKIQVENGVETPPPCTNCGALGWSELPPYVENPPVHPNCRTSAEIPATRSDLEEFYAQMGQQSAAWVRQQFEGFMEAKAAVRVNEEADRSRMFREVWGILNPTD